MKNLKPRSIFMTAFFIVIALLYVTTINKEPATTVDNSQLDEVVQDITGTHPIVKIEMEDGSEMVLELYPEYAPVTVANFVTLAESGFYDGLKFHRIVQGFMIQGGDPLGTGIGGADESIVGEFSKNGFEDNTLSHVRGVISMARSNDMNSASSQFFIMHGDSDFLDGDYAAFGKLVEGLDVLETLGNTEVEKNPDSGEMSLPVEDVIIKSISVVE